ncbi:hypothetical protein [Peribacillus butanolivorans]|uniref:hypothetical protein n=1 Tax=Peribacillus butanolivorans TaxID=421767 RepID=UPI0036DD97CB
MSVVLSQLKEWIFELSGNDTECEQKLRELLLQDKQLVRNINIAYNDSNIPRIHNLIKGYLSAKNIIVRTCKVCNKKNFISSDYLIGIKCEQCHQLLLEPMKRETIKVKEKTLKEERKKCLYCGNSVSPLSNAITCYSCC